MGIEILLVLGIIWVIVTLVGHGTWVVLAAIFGKRKSAEGGGATDDLKSCPRCHSSPGKWKGECEVCGWPYLPGARTDSRAALRALESQLARLEGLQAIDSESSSAIRASIQAQAARLAELVASYEAQARVKSATPDVPVEVRQAAALAAPVAPAEAAEPEAPRVAASPAERVREYAASRVAAIEAEPVAPPAPPPKPREALSRLFAAFMEEKNIRWGELVGGLLIVGCSVALVISFWSEIAAQPMLKFGLLGGVTAALFGVGLYTDRRWKIHNTSHGILAIATLLVPLNFLAIAAFTRGAAANDALTLAGEGLSTIVFALLVYLAGKILVRGDAVPLALGVMVPSLVQLLLRRWAEPAATLTTLYALAGVPIACYVATTAIAVRRRAVERELEEADANRLFMFLGLVSAATFFPLALLAWKVPPVEDAIHRLSPLVVWCGVPALVCGLLFWRRMSTDKLSGVQTAGIAIGVLGAAIMAGAAVAAWPDPATLLPVAAMNFVALTIVAFGFGIPAAHLPAGLSLAVIWLIAIYLRRGELGWTLESFEPLSRVLLSAMSGRMLVPLVGVFVMAAGILRRGRRRDDGLVYVIVAAVTAAASLALVVWFGFARAGDPENIVWTLGVYAIAALVAAVFVDRPAVVWIGPALLLAALWQGIVYRWADSVGMELPRVTALVVHATLMAFGAVALGWSRIGHTNLRNALRAGAAIMSALAAVLLVVGISGISTKAAAIYWAWLAVVWLALALESGWAGVFAASQIATALAIFAGVTAAVEMREWYAAAARPWLDPWFVEAQGIALAVYVLVCGSARWYFAREATQRAEEVIETPAPAWFARGEKLLEAAWPGVDQVLQVALVGVFVALAIYAVVPGAGQELAPLEAARGAGPAVRVVTPLEKFEIAGIDQTHAAGRGAWLFGAAVVASLGVVLARKRHVEQWALALVLAAGMACPLLAARWEADVAVASALRWFTAGFFAVASIALWIAARGREPLWADVRSKWIRNFLIELVALVYVALGAYVAGSALRIAGLANQLEDWLAYAVSWMLVAGISGLVVGIATERGSVVESGQSLGFMPSWRRTARNVLLLLAFSPLAILFAFAVATALDQHPIVGPELASWFRRIGWDVSYGVPLALIALTLVGHAVRDRSSGLAFSAGLLANVVATIVVLMRLARGGGSLDASAWIVVAQVNALVTGGVALVWLAAVRWSRSREPVLLVTQVALAAAFCGTFLLPAALRLAERPASGEAWLVQAGSVAGWIAFALATIAACWLNWRRSVHQVIAAFFVAALVALLSLTSLGWDTGNWLGFHTLEVGLATAAWLLPLLTLAANRLLGSTDGAVQPPAWSAISARLLGAAAIVVALRGLDGDPAAPWWTIGVLAAIALRNVWIAWREGGLVSMWIAAVLANLAVSIWWFEPGRQLSATRGIGQVLEFVWINVIAAAAMAVVSVIVTRWSPAGVSQGWIRLAYHRFAAWATAAVLLLAAGANLYADWMNDSIAANQAIAWAAWCAAALAAVACWWDARSRWPVACLYTVGLVAVGMYLDGLDFQSPMFQWALALALAAYSLVTSLLWSRRSEIAAVLARLRVATALDETGGQHWLIAVNGLWALVVLALVAWIEVTMPEFRHRMVAAYAIGAEALAIALLARGAVRSPLQYVSLLFGVLFAVAFAWAWLAPEMPAPWLHRIVAAIVALAATMVVYGLGLVKLLRRENEWTRAAQRLVPLLAVIAALLLVGVLGIEVFAFANEQPVPITWPALLAVAVALVGLAVAALVAALAPGRDPLGLSERGRTVYVYAAEVLLALTFLHIRVTMPWLFSGWFLRFWPLVVMAIAFVGVGLGEFFQRRRQNVLSGPLTTTGALLPLLPALGFWITSSEVHYSLLLLSVGVLYAAVSALRKSFWFAVLAALAANGSLWYLLHEQAGLSIAEHPQLWLIPPALCVLAAGYLNRARLSAEQSAALRYGSAIVIYASSTADIFINGVADAPWLPAVLAGLSILGVFAGILLRVRAFLYLGVTFLLVALMTIIWYAAIEQERTWILWVAGIVTGVLIIALFGVFEKRRDDVLRVVDRLKQWEA